MSPIPRRQEEENYPLTRDLDFWRTHAPELIRPRHPDLDEIEANPDILKGHMDRCHAAERGQKRFLAREGHLTPAEVKELRRRATGGDIGMKREALELLELAGIPEER